MVVKKEDKKVESEQEVTCILTGVEGENPDDCTTHDHEDAERSEVESMSEQEVTPEHSPLPWDLQIGKQCCFHDGNRVALTVWHGLDTEEPTNETIAEFWPASNDLDIKDAKFVLEAVNSHAELKERVRELESALYEVRELLITKPKVNENAIYIIDNTLRPARAALKGGKD